MKARSRWLNRTRLPFLLFLLEVEEEEAEEGLVLVVLVLVEAGCCACGVACVYKWAGEANQRIHTPAYIAVTHERTNDIDDVVCCCGSTAVSIRGTSARSSASLSGSGGGGGTMGGCLCVCVCICYVGGGIKDDDDENGVLI